MREALWETPEHLGWQIIHAYCDSQGNRRRFMHPFRDTGMPDDMKFDISFRDIPRHDISAIEDELGTLKI